MVCTRVKLILAIVLMASAHMDVQIVAGFVVMDVHLSVLIIVH